MFTPKYLLCSIHPRARCRTDSRVKCQTSSEFVSITSDVRIGVIMEEDGFYLTEINFQSFHVLLK